MRIIIIKVFIHSKILSVTEKVFIHSKILSVTDSQRSIKLFSLTHTHARTHARTHTHTQASAHASISSIQDNKQGLQAEDDSSSERKTWQIYCFGNRNLLRFDLKESRDSLCRRRRGRSFHVEGPETEKTREPAVEIEESRG